MARQRLNLVPQGLAVDVQAGPPNRPRLALERQVVEVLALRHLLGEVDRVAPAGNQLHRARRRQHLLVAPAAVLLATVLDDLVLRPDDGDLLRLLGLVAHLDEHLAADRVLPVILGQGVREDFDGEVGLLFGPVAAARLLGPAGRVVL